VLTEPTSRPPPAPRAVGRQFLELRAVGAVHLAAPLGKGDAELGGLVLSNRHGFLACASPAGAHRLPGQ